MRGGRREGAGRPKGSANRATQDQKVRLSDLARQHCSMAILTLVDVMQNGQSENARISAAIAVLDRGYGRPPKASSTQLTTTEDDPFAALTSSLGF
jgi:hypothetical protein